jgi:malate dehydrogenase (oxaloacetate-decarboxylating)
MIDASITALVASIPASEDPDAPLMPSLRDVWQVSEAVGEAVALTALREGLASRATSEEDAIGRLASCRWRPIYAPVEAR